MSRCQWWSSTLPPSHPEFLDEVMADACGRFSRMELPTAATLLLELHGSRRSLAEQQQQMGMAGNREEERICGTGGHSGHLGMRMGTQGQGSQGVLEPRAGGP